MYREILTKAIIAKGEKEFLDIHEEKTNKNLSKALGCWVINHCYKAIKNNNQIIIEGSYDVYLWFGYEKDSKCDLVKYTQQFSDEIPYTLTDSVQLDDNIEIKSFVLKQPVCVAMSFKEDTIFTKIERKYSVDLVGETKLTIKVSEVNIDKMINTNYIQEIKKVDK